MSAPTRILCAVLLVAGCSVGPAVPSDEAPPPPQPLAVDAGPVAAACDSSRCQSPPPSVCASELARRRYVSPGRCSEDVCLYGFIQEGCPFGCAGGVCDAGVPAGACDGGPCPDLCQGVECRSPPEDRCVGSNELRVYYELGTCQAQNGDCAYGYTDYPCPSGCTKDRCVADGGQSISCANVSCDYPPEAHCDGSKRIHYAGGICRPDTGLCEYEPIEVQCRYACGSGGCTLDQYSKPGTKPPGGGGG